MTPLPMGIGGRWSGMDFPDEHGPIPVPGAALLGAYWRDAAVHEADNCMWCVQMRAPEARRHASRRNVPSAGRMGSVAEGGQG